MSTIALKRMRVWLLVLTTLCVILLIAQYTYAAVRLGAPLRLAWQDWGAIISTVVLFFSYIYALKGQPHPRLHKYLRAFLMLIPTIIILYIHFAYLARYLDVTSPRPETRFVCASASCVLRWSLLFVSIIMGAFVLIEVGMTLAWGPLEKTHQYGGAHGYAQDANVVIVSPDQPQQHQQQLYYPQQLQGYYPQQQQAPIPMQYQQQQPYQYQQPVALDSNPPYQQQSTQFFQQQQPSPPQQQQQYQYPAVSVPSPVPGAEAYPQSPITTSGGYQQQPLPPVPTVSSNPQYYAPASAAQ